MHATDTYPRQLWLLKRIAGVGRDELRGCVVSAVSAAEARSYAAAAAEDEGTAIWSTPAVAIRSLGPTHEAAGIVLADSFEAG